MSFIDRDDVSSGAEPRSKNFDFREDIDHWSNDFFDKEVDRDLWPYHHEEIRPRVPACSYPDDRFAEYRLDYEDATHEEERLEVTDLVDADADAYLPPHSSTRSFGSRKSFLIEHPYKDVRFSRRFHRNRKERWAKVRTVRYECARNLKQSMQAFNN